MIYSKTYCPYSRRLKSLLTKYDIDDMKVVELNKEDQMSEMQVCNIIWHRKVTK